MFSVAYYESYDLWVNMKIRALVVDDEPLARSRMLRLIDQIKSIEVVGVAEHGEQAVELACQLQPSLIFMDVEMPRMTGISAAKIIRAKLEDCQPAIIFCTAYDGYALEAFSVNATAYLLKPFSLDDIKDAIDRAFEVSVLQGHVTKDSGPEKIFLMRSGVSAERLSFSEINYFRSEDKCVLAGMVNAKEVVVDLTLKEIELNHADQVVRVHRNSLVVKSKIQRLVRVEGKDYVRLYNCEREFQVSRRALPGVRKSFD